MKTRFDGHECGCRVSVKRRELLAKAYEDSAYVVKCPLCEAAPNLLALAIELREALNGMLIVRHSMTEPRQAARIALGHATALLDPMKGEGDE